MGMGSESISGLEKGVSESLKYPKHSSQNFGHWGHFEWGLTIKWGNYYWKLEEGAFWLCSDRELSDTVSCSYEP